MRISWPGASTKLTALWNSDSPSHWGHVGEVQ
jgi:hypothetical protein